MKLKISIKKQDMYNFLMAALIISIWAFNEEKIITYPIKILAIVLLGIYTVSRRNFNSKYQVWCLIMIVISLFATLIPENTNGSMYTFINMLQVFLIGFTVYGYTDSESKVEFILKCIVIAGIILAIRLIIVTPTSVWLSWQRLGEAIGTNSNDIGNKAAFSASIALCLSKDEKSKRIVYFIAFGILIAIVLFSGSRKALLAVVVAIVLLNTVGLRDKRKVLFAVIGVVIALVVGYYIMMNNDVLYATIGRRIESMINVFFHGATENTSISLRERYILIAWNFIKIHPLFGIGLGNFAYLSGLGVYSHCDYTEVACSYGIIGAIIYYMPLVGITIRTMYKKHKDNLDYIFLILQLILFFTYFSMVMYTNAYIQIFMCLFLAHERLHRMRRTRTII